MLAHAFFLFRVVSRKYFLAFIVVNFSSGALRTLFNDSHIVIKSEVGALAFLSKSNALLSLVIRNPIFSFLCSNRVDYSCTCYFLIFWCVFEGLKNHTIDLFFIPSAFG